ncbi:MAG: YihY/virulence factor BrkB family protein [Candidatus Zixiibacteriota bacterium]|nr:MAG: YihY/virulence factor BrkB family protein [candidate division Zixibacteria bacterium]
MFKRVFRFVATHFSIARIRGFFGYYLGGLYRNVDKHHTFLMAGGLAFSLFTCIIPLVLIVFSVLGMVLERPYITEKIDSFIDRIIPYEQYANYVKEMVFTRVTEFRLYKSIAGLIGLVGLLFASSGLFSSMRTILNTVYRAGSNGPVLRGKARDFGLILLVLIYVLLSTTILPLIDVVLKFAGQFEVLSSLDFRLVEDLAVGTASFLIIFGAYFILYFAVPQIRLPRRVVLISALAAAVLWEIAKQLFGLYLANVVSLKRIYGTYALLVVIAFWIYYSSVVFIVGAEIGQLSRDRKRLNRAKVS